MSPLVAFNVRPGGQRSAVNCQLKAPVPPVAVNVCEYAAPAAMGKPDGERRGRDGDSEARVGHLDGGT